METTRVVVCLFSWLIWRMAWKTGETVKLDHLLKDFGLSTEVSQGSWLLIEEIRLTSLIGSCSHYLQDLKRFYYVSGGEPQISKTIINSRKPDRNLDILHINYWWTPDFWSINRTQMIKRFVTGVKHTHTTPTENWNTLQIIKRLSLEDFWGPTRTDPDIPCPDQCMVCLPTFTKQISHILR